MIALFFAIGFLLGATGGYGIGHIRGVVKTDKLHAVVVNSANRAYHLYRTMKEAREAQAEAFQLLNKTE